jgi:hypothetical protein
MIASLTAATDSRVKAAAIFAYSNTYRGSILARRHCLDNYLPGVLEFAEMPDLLRLIAPRPLFLESGLNAPLFPVDQVREAAKQLRAGYAELHAEDEFGMDLFEGGHEMNGRMALDWLQTKLESVGE